MEVTKVQVRSLFGSKVQYKIPLFQRHYVWDREDQWQPLWEDITAKSCQRLSQLERQQFSHFTGAIVVDQQGTNVDEVPKYEIIDGQQRLTTFQIILCALRDICKSSSYSDIADEVRSYIRNQGMLLNDDEEYKLIPTKFDRTSFHSLVEEPIDALGNNNIHLAYRYFYEEIERYASGERERILALYHAILNDFGFVQILLGPDDKPEEIFESLNARGKRLLEFDLLRNSLFLSAREDRDTLYKRYWEHFETRYWDRKVRKATLSELFLQHFLITKLGTEDVKPEFTAYQRRYRRMLEDNLGIEYEFSELYRYSEVYREMTDCNDDSEIGQRLKFYKTFKLTTLHPFILFVICEVGLSGRELNRVFDILESYTIRRMLCCRGKNGLKNYNIFFAELIRGLRGNFSLENFIARLSAQTADFRRYPTDDEVGPALHPRYDEDPARLGDDASIVFPGNQAVKAALDGLWVETAGPIKSSLIRYILYRIELQKREENGYSEPSALSFSRKLTLEHIMPNKWKTTWHLPVADGTILYENNSVYLNREIGADVLLFSELFSDDYKAGNPDLERPSRDGLADESAYSDAFNLALVRDHLLQSVGNLTLVTGELNASMSNRPFSKKKEALYTNSLLMLNREICQHNSWDINEIRERSEKLIADFCKVWRPLDWFTENVS